MIDITTNITQKTQDRTPMENQVIKKIKLLRFLQTRETENKGPHLPCYPACTPNNPTPHSTSQYTTWHLAVKKLWKAIVGKHPAKGKVRLNKKARMAELEEYREEKVLTYEKLDLYVMNFLKKQI